MIITTAVVLPLLAAGQGESKAQGSSTEIKEPPSKAATPIEIPGPPPKAKKAIKKQPSKGATPIEIPGPSPKRKTVVKKRPSKGATPIEIPGPPPKN
ncbi:MAG: hypothetical protein M5U07_16035 [Xanthobacteraceae bacterium]|nr:hypothetical protein [Xanthobacteraceae bacterium]PWB57420.1 MAG: hypothetical protein C3F17_20570 [Bradyrhizobiaceae bacterium]